jgi:hypothetical protein
MSLFLFSKRQMGGLKAALLLAFAFACLGQWFSVAQQAAPSSAPTGTYVHHPDARKDPWPVLSQFSVPKPLFTLRLETNGTYIAKTTYGVPTQDGDLLRLLPEVARGTWRWDAEKREFLLEPANFTFYLERLPLDPQHTNRLVWGRSWLVREGTE